MASVLPDLESLRCFVAAAEHLNFRVAAKTVHLSPAAFGERIKRLEGTLGVALFVRTTRSVRISTAGDKLLAHASAVLASAEKCHAVVAASDSITPYALTVGTRFELGVSWLTTALKKLEKARPERTIHLVFGDTPALMQQLHQGRIDALITSARLAAPKLEMARLHEESYVFVAGKSYLAERPLKTAAQASAHRLLDLDASLPLFRYFLESRSAEEVWSFNATQHLGTIAAVKTRVLDGTGVAVLPHYFVRDELRQKTLTKLFAKHEMPTDWFRLIWPRGHRHDRNLRELASELAREPLR